MLKPAAARQIKPGAEDRKGQGTNDEVESFKSEVQAAEGQVEGIKPRQMKLG